MREDGAVYDLIIEELKELKLKHATPRRTTIVEDDTLGDVREEDLIENARSAVLVGRGGYIKRMVLDEFGAQSRGGRGRNAMAKDAAVEHLVTCHDHDTLLCIADNGVAYGVRAFSVPTASRVARGVPVPSVLPMDASHRIAGVLAVDKKDLQSESAPPEDGDELFLVLMTKQGQIKKMPLRDFSSLTSRGLIAIKLNDDDVVGWAKLCTARDSIVVASKNGMITRFDAGDDEIRPSGRNARGVKGMKLKDGDTIAKVDVVSPTQSHVVMVTRHGYGKRISLDQLKLQKRGGMGVAGLRFKKKDDVVVAICAAADDDEVMLVTEQGVVMRQPAAGIKDQSRTATGVLLQKSAKDDAVFDISVVPADLKEQE